jgi:hypothetical protein
MDVVVLAVVLVALAAFVAAPLYRLSGSPPPRAEAAGHGEALTTALEDLEIDRVSGLYDDAEYADERRTLETRLRPDRSDGRAD